MFSQDHFVGWALQHDEAAAPGTRFSYLRVWSQSWTLCQGRQGPQYSYPPWETRRACWLLAPTWPHPSCLERVTVGGRSSSSSFLSLSLCISNK